MCLCFFFIVGEEEEESEDYDPFDNDPQAKLLSSSEIDLYQRLVHRHLPLLSNKQYDSLLEANPDAEFQNIYDRNGDVDENAFMMRFLVQDERIEGLLRHFNAPFVEFHEGALFVFGADWYGCSSYMASPLLRKVFRMLPEYEFYQRLAMADNPVSLIWYVFFSFLLLSFSFLI